jgi:diacylglycerol kinase (ATP)
MNSSILPFEKVALVVNTKSRRGRKMFDMVQKELATLYPGIESYPIEKGDELVIKVRKLVEDGIQLLIIGGGDGTVSEVIDEAAYKDVVLGILPLGTANSFVRSFAIPVNLPEAIRNISHGKVIQIDLGKINDDYFANAVSIGFATTIADHIPHSLKRSFGILAYAVEGLRSLFTLQSFNATFTSSEKDQSVTTYQIIIANGAFYGPSAMLSKKRLRSGDITIFTMDHMSPLQLLKAWVFSLAGEKLSQQDIAQFTVEGEVHLVTHPVKEVSIDGEIKTKTPLTIGVAPQAVKLLVPQDFEW